jgi:hypothetical protein
MATKEEMAELYRAQLQELNVDVNEELLDWCIDRVGPANYNADGQTVACSDTEELEGVYSGFVGDELGETDKVNGMAEIEKVCEIMNEQHRKYRAVFYYLLARAYGK